MRQRPWLLFLVLSHAVVFSVSAQETPAPLPRPSVKGKPKVEPPLERPAEAPPTVTPAGPDAGGWWNHAGLGIRLRPWLILTPSLRTTAVYDTNVRRAGDGAEDSAIELSNTFALNLLALRKTSTLRLGYTVTDRRFSGDQDDLNGVDHTGTLGLEVRGLRTRVALTGSVSTLTRPTDPSLPGGSSDRRTGSGLLSLSWEPTGLVGVLLEGGLQYTDFDDEEAGAGQMGVGADGFLTLRLPVPGQLQLGGGYRELRYTDDEPFDADLGIVRGVVGYAVEGRALTDELRALRAQLRVGFEQARILSKPDTSTLDDDDAPSGFVLSGSLQWQVRRQTAVAVNLFRGITLSNIAAAQITTRAELTLSEAIGPDLRATGELSYELQDLEDSGDIRSVGGALGLAWAPRRWIEVALNASGERVQRDATDGGDFDVLRAGASLTLRF